jgi:hypothetical protein
MPTHNLEIEPLDWSTEFLPWFRDAWKPGQHVALIAPTGAGKTTFAAGLLNLRKYVLALDAKGGDSTLDALDFARIEKWPGTKAMTKKVEDNEKNDIASRFVIGNKARSESEIEQLSNTLEKTLNDAYEMGGWTVYADELMLLTDHRLFGLRRQVDRLLIAARDLGVSFVSSFQAPKWVTPMAGNQATWIAVSYTRDVDVVNRLAEILGRPKNEIRGAIKGLEQYSWLIIGRNPREPIRVTIPDYVEPKKKQK